MNKMIIGLAGFKGSGKTTAANYLTDTLGIATAYPLAEPIKDIAKQLYPDLIGLDLDDQTVKDHLSIGGRKVRDILVGIGQGLRRDLGSDVWCEVVGEKLSRLPKYADRIVIPDIRMPHEAEWLRNLGGTLIWIDNPNCSTNGCSTEQDLSQMADAIITNNPETMGMQGLGYVLDDIVCTVGW